MVINMDESPLRTIEQIEQFLAASAEVTFTAHGDDVERYAHISRVLKRFDYPRCSKRQRGVLLRYLQHTSDYSRAQVTRLVKRYRAPAAPFARKYTALDIELLVEMDKTHEDVCGPAITHLLKRAFSTYGDMRYERLAKLSNAVANSVRPSAFSVRTIHEPVLRTKVSLATSSLRPATLTQQATLTLIRQTVEQVVKPD